MKTSGDLQDECNEKATQYYSFVEEHWWQVSLVIGFVSGMTGAMFYAYIMSPFLK